MLRVCLFLFCAGEGMAHTRTINRNCICENITSFGRTEKQERYIYVMETMRVIVDEDHDMSLR